MSEQQAISWTQTDEPPGLVLIDEIDRCRCVLHTTASTTPTPIPTDRFEYPVDSAVTVRTAAITIPKVTGVNLRDPTGKVLTRTEEYADESHPAGSYVLELSIPLKVYLAVDSTVSISANTTRTRIDFGTETAVTVGARSRHQSPAGTITTTDRPTDVMAAVSALGSGLKTTTCKRSYPTLRGHPPVIERGQTLDIPEELAPRKRESRSNFPPNAGSSTSSRRWRIISVRQSVQGTRRGSSRRPASNSHSVPDTSFKQRSSGC